MWAAILLLWCPAAGTRHHGIALKLQAGTRLLTHSHGYSLYSDGKQFLVKLKLFDIYFIKSEIPAYNVYKFKNESIHKLTQCLTTYLKLHVLALEWTNSLLPLSVKTTNHLYNTKRGFNNM